MAASATLALKAGVWFRRGRRCIVSPDSLAQRARRQAETPLIALFRFPRPALAARETFRMEDVPGADGYDRPASHAVDDGGAAQAVCPQQHGRGALLLRNTRRPARGRSAHA